MNQTKKHTHFYISPGILAPAGLHAAVCRVKPRPRIIFQNINSEAHWKYSTRLQGSLKQKRDIDPDHTKSVYFDRHEGKTWNQNQQYDRKYSDKHLKFLFCTVSMGQFTIFVHQTGPSAEEKL